MCLYLRKYSDFINDILNIVFSPTLALNYYKYIYTIECSYENANIVMLKDREHLYRHRALYNGNDTHLHC